MGKTGQFNGKLPQGLMFVAQRGIFLYLIVGLLLFMFIDQRKARGQYLSFLEFAEHYLEALSRGNDSFDCDKLRWALRYYNELKYLVPDEPSLYGNVGFLYFYLGDRHKAIANYQEARKLHPPLYYPAWDLGMVYFDMKNYDEAQNVLQEAVDRMPGTVTFVSHLKESIEQKGRKDLIPMVLELINRVADDNEKAFVQLSNIAYFQSSFQKMNQVALKGLEGHPQSEKLNFNAAFSYYMLKKYRESVVYFNKVVSLNPKNISAYYYRAICYGHLKDAANKSKDLLRVAFLEREGVKRREEFVEDFRLHLNTQLITLRYRTSYQ